MLVSITALTSVSVAIGADESVVSVIVPKVEAPPSLEADADWPAAAKLRLDWDFTNGRAATETTDVRIATDEAHLYVRFIVMQREPLVATQHVNDSGDGSDDEVSVYLWPSGRNGFRYQFSATPNGTHYQYSTENAIYGPTWISTGSATAGGYVVTMVIPRAALRADGRSVWLAQFSRFTQRAGAVSEWTHQTAQAAITSSLSAGKLGGLDGDASASRAQPRIGVYALGESAGRSIGGPTSRLGADLAIPLTATSSFVAAIHPDFSNVEIDQQTIAPTTFARSYAEVRPFFSQSAANIYSGNCYGCPYISELYTPAIPTPRDGYAFEGTQGPLTFGAFDALGVDRNDTAETVQYTTPSRHFRAWETRVGADLPGVHDLTDLVAAAYDSNTHYQAYLDYGTDSGTNVLDGSQAQRYDGGFAYYSKDDFNAFTMRKIGRYYDPVDGLISLTDISGYSAQINHTFQFGSRKRFQTLALNMFLDHYVGTTGGTDLTDGDISATLTTRSKFTLSATTGFSYVRLPGDILRPANQQGVGLQFQSGTALQDQFLYNIGRFGDGWLTSIDRDVAVRLMRHATVNLNADSTLWRGDTGLQAVQWLERLGMSFDLGPRSSLTVGVRKIVGAPPPFGTSPTFASDTNVAFGYSVRRPHDELYFVYGDASQLNTRPAITLKYIHYFGAEKGT